VLPKKSNRIFHHFPFARDPVLVKCLQFSVLGLLEEAPESPWLGTARFAEVREVVSLIESSAHLSDCKCKCYAKVAHFVQGEDLQCKSCWRLRFEKKESGGSRILSDKSLTDICLWRSSVRDNPARNTGWATFRWREGRKSQRDRQEL